MREPKPKGHQFESDLGTDSTAPGARLPEQMVKLPGYEARPAIAVGTAPDLESGKARVDAEYVGTPEQKRDKFREWFMEALEPSMVGGNDALNAIRYLSMCNAVDLGINTDPTLHTEQILCRTMLEIRELLLSNVKPSELAGALANLKEGNRNIGINRFPNGDELNFMFRNISIRNVPPQVVTPAYAVARLDSKASACINPNKYNADGSINRNYGSATRKWRDVVSDVENELVAWAAPNGPRAQADAKFMVKLGAVIQESFFRPAELGFDDVVKYDSSVGAIAIFRKLLKSPTTIPFVAERIPESLGPLATSYLNFAKDEANTPSGLGISAIEAIFDPRCKANEAELRARDFNTSKPLNIFYLYGLGYANNLAEILDVYALNPRAALVKALPEKWPGMFPVMSKENKVKQVEPLYGIMFEGAQRPGKSTRLKYAALSRASIFEQQGLSSEAVMDRDHMERFLKSPQAMMVLDVGNVRENEKIRQRIINGQFGFASRATGTIAGGVGWVAKGVLEAGVAGVKFAAGGKK